MNFTLVYGSNGFTEHRLADAVAVLAHLGCQGLSSTLDRNHLGPFASNLARRITAVSALLQEYGFSVAVETGAPYALNPWNCFKPSLVSDTDRTARINLLLKAVDVAADPGCGVVWLWLGPLPRGCPPAEGWDRLLAGVEALLPRAAAAGVVLGFEPEPDMMLARVADVLDLQARLGDPHEVQITLDVGHAACNELQGPAECVRAAGDALAHVQVEDIRGGVHQHLEFGEDDIDFPPVMAALQNVRFTGLVSVELAQHSHLAPEVARPSLDALRTALAAAGEHCRPALQSAGR